MGRERFIVPLICTAFSAAIIAVLVVKFVVLERPPEVFVDVTLSSLSEPKGKIDIFWNFKPRGESDPRLLNLYGYKGAIASPLDLIEEFTIRNTTSESIFLEAIANENMQYIKTPPRLPEDSAHATPIMLLPDTYISKEGDRYKCRNRNIEHLLGRIYLSSTSIPDQYHLNNVCVFESPIEVKANSTLSLRPTLYAVSYGVAGTYVLDVFYQPQRGFVKAPKLSPAKEVWLLPKSYEEYDDVARRNTFNIGGFIVANTSDEDFMNSIFRIKNKEGKEIPIRVGRRNEGIYIESYSIPNEPFLPNMSERDEKVLGMQVFWYLNGFWGAENITGMYDHATADMLKRFQRLAGIADTGSFDSATMHVMRAFTLGPSHTAYEIYGDEVIAITPDGKNGLKFRLFSTGKYAVRLSKDNSYDTLLSAIELEGCQEPFLCAAYARMGSGDKLYISFEEILILNNTPAPLNCTLLNSLNEEVRSFLLLPNEIVSQPLTLKGLSHPQTHVLECGRASLEIDLAPLQN